jgi:quinol monooxygenase YgiN
MVKIVDLDENVNIKAQVEENTGVVMLLNKFIVKPEYAEQFLKAFEKTTTKFMKKQPGFISYQLHQGIAGGQSHTFFNYGVWESAGHFKQAFNNPKFQSNIYELTLTNTV